MIVLGIDPGASVTSCTLLRARLSGALALSFHKSDEVANEDLVGYLLECPAHVVGIERPAGIAYGTKGAGIVPHLLDTAHAAGLAEGVVESRRRQGSTVLRWLAFPATTWRRSLVGKPGPTNAEIASGASPTGRLAPTTTSATPRARPFTPPTSPGSRS